MKKEQNNQTQFKDSKHDEIFKLVRLDNKVRIAIGRNIVSKKEFESFKAADEYIAQKPYELLINVSLLILEIRNENKSKENEKDSEVNN